MGNLILGLVGWLSSSTLQISAAQKVPSRSTARKYAMKLLTKSNWRDKAKSKNRHDDDATLLRVRQKSPPTHTTLISNYVGV